LFGELTKGYRGKLINKYLQCLNRYRQGQWTTELARDLSQLSDTNASLLVKDLQLKFKLATSNSFDTSSEQAASDSESLANKSIWTPLHTQYANSLATAITLENSWHRHESLLDTICHKRLDKFKNSPAVLQHVQRYVLQNVNDQERNQHHSVADQPKTTHPQKAASEFLERITPLEDYVADRSIVTVAVVGNSPNILQKENGESIDNADCVIRFNNTSTDDSYLKHTGRKVDIWVATPGYDFKALKTIKSKHVCLSGYFPYKRSSKYWDTLSRHSNTGFLKFPKNVWPELTTKLQAPPSAGLQCLTALSRSNCRIRAYGFTLDRELETARDKNHFTDSRSRSNRHNWEAESTLLKKLADNHVEFF